MNQINPWVNAEGMIKVFKVKSWENLNIVAPFIKIQPDNNILTTKLEDATDASSPIYNLLNLNTQDQEWILRNNFNKPFYMEHISKNHNVPSISKQHWHKK